MGFKYVIGAIAICLSFSATVAHALPSYEYNAGGEIVGISSVDVQGALWDMTLHDGSFDALYGSIGAAALYSEEFSQAASFALYDFTVNDSHTPDTFLGCTFTLACHLFTAYEYRPLDVGVFGWSDYYSDQWDSVQAVQFTSTFNQSNATWATWEKSSSNVPEPSIAILMASGLLAFGVVRRKTKA